MDALNNGESVRAVIHYGKCELIVDSVAVEAPDAIGGMEFQTFEYFAKMSIRNNKAYVTTSETVLIGHPYYGYVYNYAKLRIYEDNSVEIETGITEDKDHKTIEKHKYVERTSDEGKDLNDQKSTKDPEVVPPSIEDEMYNGPSFDVLLGDSTASKQFGI